MSSVKRNVIGEPGNKARGEGLSLWAGSSKQEGSIMGHQPNSDHGQMERNQSGSQKQDQKMNPQNQNKNDNNSAQSNQADNRTSQQNTGGRTHHQH